MAQFARPASDITTTNWTPSAGGALFGVIDESSADDADFISTGTQSAVAEVKLGSVTDPVGNVNHIVRWRARSSGSGQSERQTVALFQATTLIATLIAATDLVRTTWTQSDITLSGAQADAITDYTDLRIRFTAERIGASETYQVSWAELEVPDVALSPLSVNKSDSVAVAEAVAVSVEVLPDLDAFQIERRKFIQVV